MTKWLAVLGALAGVALIVYALLGAPSEEERIERKLGQLAQAVSFAKRPANRAIQALRLQGEFERAFVERPVVEIEELGLRVDERQSLVQLALHSTQVFETLELRLSRVRVRLNEDKTTAEVSARAWLTGLRDDTPERERRPFTGVLVKSADGWRISRVTVPASEE